MSNIIGHINKKNWRELVSLDDNRADVLLELGVECQAIGVHVEDGHAGGGAEVAIQLGGQMQVRHFAAGHAGGGAELAIQLGGHMQVGHLAAAGDGAELVVQLGGHMQVGRLAPGHQFQWSVHIVHLEIIFMIAKHILKNTKKISVVSMRQTQPIFVIGFHDVDNMQDGSWNKSLSVNMRRYT